MSVPIRVPAPDPSGEIVKNRFLDFLRNFREDRADIANVTTQQRLMSDYMAQMATMMQNNKSTVYVNFQHVMQMDHELAEAIELDYYRFEPYLRHAIHECIAEDNQHYVIDVDRGQREFFVSIYNLPRVERIRSMKTEKIGRLVSVSGTVTRSSEVRPELLYGSFVCKKCGTMHPGVEQQFQYTEPQICKNPQCSKGDFQPILNQSAFVDWQRLRVQENADEIPPGSMPRCVDIICRNEIVELAKAGDKMVFTGTVAVVPDTSGLARAGESTTTGRSSGRSDNYGDGVAGLKRLGVREMTYRILFIACSVQSTDQRTGGPVNAVSYTELAGASMMNELDKDACVELSDADQADILSMHNSHNLYGKMVESICPQVFGHSEVKRGVLLMLFGGVHKVTEEGISLRGDLNVCIVGDPSCAKSQFLKYVHSFLPRSVYTSGKSSSAAGLTASVVRDSETGEFCVEAGALMLADNGICCIDEFDKMDPGDQVAIHEAMEQQTISITKAGIQATLNARTSILAAANPVFGRYDRTKTLKANVAISAPIMSRFDLFFVILDECNASVDEQIARHIIGNHRQEKGRRHAEREREEREKSVPFTTEQLRKYIRYARTLNPRLTKASRRMLVDCYRLLRQNDILGKNKTAYRITVRQLESLTRLSEALARLHLEEEVLPEFVQEAFRLLQKSIIYVETEDVELDENEEDINRVRRNYRDNVPGQEESGDNVREDGEGHPGDDGHTPLERDDDEEYDPEDEGAKRKRRGEKDHEVPGASSSDGREKRRRDDSGQQSEERGEDDDGSGGGTRGEMAAPSKSSKKGENKKKTKTQISAKEYENMTQLLALHLKSLEDQNPDFEGCLWRDLLEWYLTQFQHELTSEQVFDEKKKVVSQVIRRMIKHEGTIVVLGGTGTAAEGVPNEEKVLKLHPSYQP